MNRVRKPRPLIAVVDDDDSVRESLPDLLRELGYDSEAFSSAEQFLASERTRAISCSILDIGLPKITGPELHRLLVQRGQAMPTIFITGRAQGSVTRSLLPDGALCLYKPFSEEALSAALNAVLR